MIWIWSLFASVAAASVNDLVGTWTTKSRDVLTGPVRLLAVWKEQELTKLGILRSAS